MSTHRGGEEARILRWRVGGVFVAGFLVAHVFAVVALVGRFNERIALGGRATQAEVAIVGFEPLVAAMLGWTILLAGLGVVLAMYACATGRWSVSFVLSLLLGVPFLGLLFGGILRVFSVHYDGAPPLRVPIWVDMIQVVAEAVHPVAGIGCVVALWRRFRRSGTPSTADGVLAVGAFAVVAAVTRLHGVAIHSCALYSILLPMAPPFLAGWVGGQVLRQSWGSIILAWLGLAALTVGLPALRGGADRAEEGR